MEYVINILNNNYKLIEYYKNKVVAVNCFSFDGDYEKYDDVIIIRWANNVIHYFIETNNIYYQYIFDDFDLDFYKTQTTDIIDWNNCFKHWLIYGRKQNLLYQKYFDDIKVYYINLEKRKDRNEQIINELKKGNIVNYEKYNAIDKNIINVINEIDVLKLWNIDNEPPKIGNVNDEKYICGVYGCYKSHLEIMELFLKQNEKQYLLIMEDDYFIEHDIKEKISKCLNYIEENKIIFNMLYLSMALFEHNGDNKIFTKISDNLLKIKKTYGSTTHAIIYDINTIYNVIDFLKKDLIIELDQKLKKIENRYCIYPMLGYQIPDKSNIGSFRENSLIKDEVVDYGKFNEMYNFDNEPINNNIVIFIENIETEMFKNLYDKISDKYCVVKCYKNDKKNIVFGNREQYYEGDIIITNNISCTKNFFIIDDFDKYENKENIFFITNDNIESVLCSVNLMKIYDVKIKIEQTDINVVHLRHSKDRFYKFIKNNSNKNINFIPAIKYNPLFLGCVLSNKMIIHNAICQNLNYVQICEDDVIIKDYSIIVKSINFLNKYKKWNLLSSFVVNIEDDYVVEEVIQITEKYKLLKINNWCSTVFNIYNKNCFDVFMKYEEDKINLNEFDKDGNLIWTIDRKIKFKDIYLIYPYPVDIENVKSEIWNNENSYEDYISMKNKSYDKIRKMITTLK
jgi:GR25 family glycosyltransferase involved in LPS biosynthesis